MFRVISGVRLRSLPSPARGARLAWDALASMYQMIEGRRHIARMDARMLADIGLSRADAEEEVRRKPWDSTARPRN